MPLVNPKYYTAINNVKDTVTTLENVVSERMLKPIPDEFDKLVIRRELKLIEELKSFMNEAHMSIYQLEKLAIEKEKLDNSIQLWRSRINFWKNTAIDNQKENMKLTFTLMEERFKQGHLPRKSFAKICKNLDNLENDWKTYKQKKRE